MSDDPNLATEHLQAWLWDERPDREPTLEETSDYFHGRLDGDARALVERRASFSAESSRDFATMREFHESTDWGRLVVPPPRKPIRRPVAELPRIAPWALAGASCVLAAFLFVSRPAGTGIVGTTSMGGPKVQRKDDATLKRQIAVLEASLGGVNTGLESRPKGAVELLKPVATAVVTPAPILEWSAPGGAAVGVVELRRVGDAALLLRKPVAADASMLDVAEEGKPLAPGRYAWTVLDRAGKPLAEGRFAVLDPTVGKVLENAAEDDDPRAVAVSLASLGAFDVAEAALESVARNDPLAQRIQAAIAKRRAALTAR